MSFIPDEALRGREGINLAPMIDFLFLMLMFFACLAVSRATSKDTDIELVEVAPEANISQTVADTDTKIINISIDAEGNYKWVTEVRDYRMQTPDEIAQELIQQHTKGLLPKDKSKTQVLLKIDKKTVWDPILKAIFAIRDAGFEVHPVYEPMEVPMSSIAQSNKNF